MIPLYQSTLKPEEYESYVKHGAAMYLASAALQLPGIKKEAQSVGEAMGAMGNLGDHATKLLLTLSVVTGVPAGIMLHVIGKRIGERKLADRQIIEETGYYSNAAKGLESEMARQGMKAAASVIPDPAKGDEGFVPSKLTKTPPQKVVQSMKAASALRALKLAQESEIETGDEDNQAPPQEQPALPIPEPTGLLAAVGEQPKDPGQQQNLQTAPSANNEVVAKSNITAPGLMMTGGNTRGRV